MKFVASINGRLEIVHVTRVEGGYRVTLGERTIDVDARRPAAGIYSLLIDGMSHVADVSSTDGGTLVDLDGATYLVEVEEHARHLIRTRGGAGAGAAGQTIRARAASRSAPQTISLATSVS